jgi:hypothetical protein
LASFVFAAIVNRYSGRTIKADLEWIRIFFRRTRYLPVGGGSSGELGMERLAFGALRYG